MNVLITALVVIFILPIILGVICAVPVKAEGGAERAGKRDARSF